MALLVIRQTVRDAAAWRAAYDRLAEVRADWGVLADAVHEGAEAPDTVLVLHHFATVAQAQGYLTCRELRRALLCAGVAGEAHIEIYR